MKLLPIIVSVFTLILAGCYTLPKEYNWSTRPGVDIGANETFSIDRPEAPSNLSGDQLALWEKRMMRIDELITDNLIAKGYRAEDDAQLNVAFTGTRELRFASRMEAFALEAELNIFVTDTNSGKWVWHAWSTEVQAGAIDLDEEIEITVPKMMVKFPRSTAQ